MQQNLEFTIENIIPVPTPQAWFEYAVKHINLMLLDHAHCEKKAAGSALALIYRYDHDHVFVSKLSKIVREEMRHFEQVLVWLKQRGENYKYLPPGSYAKKLHKLVRKNEPGRLLDLLLVAAIVEARSCERFQNLVEYLKDTDASLGSHYSRLYQAEKRHFELYIQYACKYAQEEVAPRLQEFVEMETSLILTEDPVFRFHSGLPV